MNRELRSSAIATMNCGYSLIAHNAGVEANQARNAIIHAHWGFNTDYNLVIEDLKDRSKCLPIIKQGIAGPSELFEIVEQIERSNEALMDFCRLFAGVYHRELRIEQNNP